MLLSPYARRGSPWHARCSGAARGAASRCASRVAGSSRVARAVSKAARAVRGRGSERTTVSFQPWPFITVAMRVWASKRRSSSVRSIIVVLLSYLSRALAAACRGLWLRIEDGERCRAAIRGRVRAEEVHAPGVILPLPVQGRRLGPRHGRRPGRCRGARPQPAAREGRRATEGHHARRQPRLEAVPPVI